MAVCLLLEVVAVAGVLVKATISIAFGHDIGIQLEQ